MPVVSDGQSVVDVILQRYRVPGVPGGGGGGGESPCEVSVVRLPELGGVDIVDRWQPDSVPVEIRCGGAFLDSMWLPIPEVVGGLVQGEVERYVRSVLAPGLSMGTSPPSNVLVGLSTWFWLDGWDGAPITVPVVAPWGATVTVELSLGDVRWDFGDGSAPLSGSLGRAYPEESPIRHVFTHRSTSRTDPNGSYPVTVSLRIDARYWYEGMGPYSVAPLVQEHTEPVVVRQLQAVLG